METFYEDTISEMKKPIKSVWYTVFHNNVPLPHFTKNRNDSICDCLAAVEGEINYRSLKKLPRRLKSLWYNKKKQGYSVKRVYITPE